MNILSIFLLVFTLIIVFYTFLYQFFRNKVIQEELFVISVFVSKISKVPALIEVMRPYVFDDQVFRVITQLHSDALMQRRETLYDLLEINARIEHEFVFLMKLSVQIPDLQKDEYFLYIRDFIINYEKKISSHFMQINRAIHIWNRFVSIKNLLIIGYILPGTHREPIR